MPTINYTPLTTARRFLLSEAPIRVLIGARGSGKSTAALMAMLWDSTRTDPKYWPLRYMIVRDTRANLGRTFARTLTTWFPEPYARLKGKVDEPDAADIYIGGKKSLRHVVHCDMFGVNSASDFSRFQSYEASGGIIIEEPAPLKSHMESISSGIQESVLSAAISCLRAGPNPRVVIASNPPSGDAWLAQLFHLPGWEMFPEAEMDMSEEQLQARESIRKMSEVFLTPQEECAAEILTPGYRAKMRDALLATGDTALVSRLVEGRIGSVDVGLRVAPEFHGGHIVSQLPVMANVPAILSFDYGLCYDDQTDVLTREGWKPFEEVAYEDEIATMHPETRQIEYHRPERVVKRWYTGEMLHWKTAGLDLCVTPEHRVPYVTEHAPATIRWKTAEELSQLRSGHNSVLLKAGWEGAVGEGYGPLGWAAGVYADFMGLWLSEGTVAKRYGNIRIVQIKDAPWIEAILEATGLEWKRVRDGWEVYHRPLAEYLRRYGKQPVRYVPREICEMPAAYIGRFIDAYTLGDGHRRVRQNGAEEHTIFTSSKQMAGDLQELALKMGWYSSARWVVGARRWIEVPGTPAHWIEGRGGYQVTFKKGMKGRGEEKERTPCVQISARGCRREMYEGMIYCVTVPNHIIYVRRNGRPCWNGNSPTCIVAQVTPQGYLNILRAWTRQNVGMKQLLEQDVQPWLTQSGLRSWWYCGGAEAREREQSDSEETALKVILRTLGTARYQAAPVSWSARRQALKEALTRSPGGFPWVRISQEGAALLIRCLDGGWAYATDASEQVRNETVPPKNRYSHLGDAMCALCAVLLRKTDPGESRAKRPGTVRYPATPASWTHGQSRTRV